MVEMLRGIFTKSREAKGSRLSFRNAKPSDFSSISKEDMDAVVESKESSDSAHDSGSLVFRELMDPMV